MKDPTREQALRNLERKDKRKTRDKRAEYAERLRQAGLVIDEIERR
jgi:predicted SprT family Zn-dependent metalloprotease